MIFYIVIRAGSLQIHSLDIERQSMDLVFFDSLVKLLEAEEALKMSK